MKINEFIQEVHDNAKLHGWWDGGERPVAELISLIHSEWSEALEEARAENPMLYINDSKGNKCEIAKLGSGVVGLDNCKPEGIGVELIDGVIRIFDLFGKYGYKVSRGDAQMLIEASKKANPMLGKKTALAMVVMTAHDLTAKAGEAMLRNMPVEMAMAPLEACTGFVLAWVQMQGWNPEQLLKIKHEYNKTRPYKHGKKF